MDKKAGNLGILVGLLLTDGCVSSKRFLVFHNKSEVMHQLFQKQVSKVFGDIHFTQRIESNGTKRTQVSSKLVVRKLLEMCEIKTFRRKQFENGKFPSVKLPPFFGNLTRDSLFKILQVVFSADGSISIAVRWHKGNDSWEIRRRIELTCKHPKLRNDFFTLISSIGFSPRTSHENITLEKKSDIQKFANEIRFVPGIKVGGDSKNWKGFEKNQILDLAIKTFDLGKKDLQQFKTKDEVISFLKSELRV